MYEAESIFSVNLLINEHTCRLSPFRCLMYEAESIFSVHPLINALTCRLSPFRCLMYEAESCPLSFCSPFLCISYTMLHSLKDFLISSSSYNSGMDHVGIEPKASRMLSGCDATRPITLTWQVSILVILTLNIYIYICIYRSPPLASFSSCISSFRASPHKCPYMQALSFLDVSCMKLNPAHFPFAHHFCASPTQSFTPCEIFSSLLPLTILGWTMWELNPRPPAC